MKKTNLTTQALVALLLASTAGTALAQTPAEPAPPKDGEVLELAEIIVTARKRKENLQDVPLTISVVGADAIARTGAENITDLAEQTPGLSIKPGFGRTGGGRPSIRGMSSILGDANAAFFVDGVYIANNINSYQLDNIERVEVIKGPQSALFGRQTFSGAINFITRRPTNELKGQAKLTVAQYDQIEATGYVSGPIIEDKLLMEINARKYNFGGDYVNADNGKRELGAQNSTNVGGRLLFTPTENFEAILSVGFSKDRDKGYIYGFQGSAKNNCYNATVVGAIGTTPRASSRARGFYCGEVETLDSYAYNNDELEALGYHGLEREFYRTSLALNYEFENDWSITSTSAYNHNENITGQDNTLVRSTAPSLTVSGRTQEDYSQELRVMSPQSERIRGLAGVYYFHDDLPDGFSVVQATGARQRFDSKDGVRSKSAFAMIEGDVTDGLTLGAEARYQKETIQDTDEVLGPANGAVGQPVNLKKAKFDAFLPRFTARYKVDTDMTLFATAAKGNKPGGFNSLPTDAQPAEVQRLRDAGLGVFDEEGAWSYEVGAKGTVMDAVNYSASAFLIDWTKQQLTRGEPYIRANGTPNSAALIQNAGKSEIKGFEVDVSGNAADWLFLRFAYTYVNAEFVDFYDEVTEEIYDTDGRASRLANGQPNPADVDGLDGDLKGNKLPQTPSNQFTVTTQITRPLSADLDFVWRTDFAYESKRFSQVDNLNHTGDSLNVNMNVSVEAQDWTFALFARNLLDDRTPLVVTRLLDFSRPIFRPNPLGGNQLTFLRDFAVSAPRKRQFGASFTYRF
jgi:outer membrane receptor protein involved in Fe transport